MRLEVLDILRCPEDFTTLSVAAEPVVGQLNAVVRDGRLVNRAGKRLEHFIEGGLVRAAGDMLYPIVDQIPVLLRDEAIELNQIGHPTNSVTG